MSTYAAIIISGKGSTAAGLRADGRSSPKSPASESPHPAQLPDPQPKRKRNKGNPDPEAEVVALSPRTLVAGSTYSCEVCGMGFERYQNLQVHRRSGHNLPWRLNITDFGGARGGAKKVYVCPVESCVYHHPSRALSELAVIRKHYLRMHGEKKLTCRRCSKTYAVLADWKAHVRRCGTKESKCRCGAIFYRKDSFANHIAFCKAATKENTTNAPSAAALATGLALAATATGVGDGYAPLVGQKPPPSHQFPLSWGNHRNPNPNSITFPPQPIAKDPKPLQHRFIPSGGPSVTQRPPSIAPNSVAQHLHAAAVLRTAATARQMLTRIRSTTNYLGIGTDGLGVGGPAPGRQMGDYAQTRDFLGMIDQREHRSFPFNDGAPHGGGGGLNFMASTTPAAPQRASMATNATAPAIASAVKTEPPEGSPSPYSAAYRTWWNR